MIDFNKHYIIDMVKENNPRYENYTEKKICKIDPLSDKGYLKASTIEQGYQDTYFYNEYFEHLIYRGIITVVD